MTGLDASLRSPWLRRRLARHQLSRSRQVLRTAGMGHEDPFPRPGPNGRCRFGQEIIAGTHCNGRNAPYAVISETSIERAAHEEPIGVLMRRARFRGGLTGPRPCWRTSFSELLSNTFNLQPHLVSRATLRIFPAEAPNQWQDAVAAG